MKRKIWIGTLAFTLLAIVGYFGLLSKKDALPLIKNKRLAAKRIVQVVSPKVLESAGISASQLCVLEPLERAELNSRLPGIVKKITKNMMRK